MSTHQPRGSSRTATSLISAVTPEGTAGDEEGARVEGMTGARVLLLAGRMGARVGTRVGAREVEDVGTVVGEAVRAVMGALVVRPFCCSNARAEIIGRVPMR